MKQNHEDNRSVHQGYGILKIGSSIKNLETENIEEKDLLAHHLFITLNHEVWHTKDKSHCLLCEQKFELFLAALSQPFVYIVVTRAYTVHFLIPFPK